LYFTFEPSQSAFERLAILQMDFCQLKFTTFQNFQYTVAALLRRLPDLPETIFPWTNCTISLNLLISAQRI
jgi:hypothetical protein